MGVCNPKINVTSCLHPKGIVQMYIWEMKKAVRPISATKVADFDAQPLVLQSEL